MEKDTRVLIVGGEGTFGLSTAWHLARSGYTRVTCLDRWSTPSRSSAGYDLNKIVRTEYVTPLYTKLAHEAVKLWRDPMFKDVYHETGWVFGTDGTEELGRVQAFDDSVQNTKSIGDPSKMVELQDLQSTIDKFPCFGYGRESNVSQPEFRAIFNQNAGWVDPMKAMQVIKAQCESLGVSFITGKAGTVVSLLRDHAGNVKGVCSEDGTETLGDRIILAVGPYSDTLLDFEGQLEATAYVVTHIRLPEDLYNRYKDMPVVNISRRGYVFPPKQDRILKACSTDVSYLVSKDPSTRASNGWGSVSTPRDSAYHPTDTQPTHGYQQTQSLLKFILPGLAGVEVDSSRLCWDAEAFDYHWIISRHPSSPKSLFIATGGSGHSFKNIVHIGRFVQQLLEDSLEESLIEAWRWRPEKIGTSPEKEERARRPKLELWEASGWNHESET
ncbi:FAD-dependent oxidoreductase [Xylaria sp. FL1777]|nr:FAD-dependent oxidoreductase [Xylaria sp. FL1777]